MSEGRENKNIHRGVNCYSTHFRGLDGVLIVCDASQPSLLERIKYWLKVVDEKTGYNETPVPVLIMVNKIDCLYESTEVSLDRRQLDKLCNGGGGRTLDWFATSAKTGMNVEACIKELVRITLSTPGRLKNKSPPLAESISENDLKSLSEDIARLRKPFTITKNPSPRSKKNNSQVNKHEAAAVFNVPPESNEVHHRDERVGGCKCVLS